MRLDLSMCAPTTGRTKIEVREQKRPYVETSNSALSEGPMKDSRRTIVNSQVPAHYRCR